MKLSAKQTEALEMIRDRGASGTCIRYVWIFQSAGKVITRQVKELERKGFVTISYYREGQASVTAIAA